jgi:hypothetical protein
MGTEDPHPSLRNACMVGARSAHCRTALGFAVEGPCTSSGSSCLRILVCGRYCYRADRRGGETSTETFS